MRYLFVVGLLLSGHLAWADCPTIPAGAFQRVGADDSQGVIVTGFSGGFGVTAFGLSAGAFIPPDPANVEWQCYLAWEAAGNTPLAAPVAVPSTVVSKSAFLALFTSAELTGIATAAQTTPAVNVWLITAEAYDTINLADPLTKSGLDALVAGGLLTSARETAILANQPPG
jgi:hypothetical protein